MNRTLKRQVFLFPCQKRKHICPYPQITPPFADMFQPCWTDETIIAEGKEKGRWEVEKVEYKNIFKSEDGAVLEMKIKADCPTQEDMHKTISFVAKSARKFYLQVAEEINNTL